MTQAHPTIVSLATDTALVLALATRHMGFAKTAARAGVNQRTMRRALDGLPCRVQHRALLRRYAARWILQHVKLADLAEVHERKHDREHPEREQHDAVARIGRLRPEHDHSDSK